MQPSILFSPPHPVSIFPELGCYLGSGQAAASWSQFRALNPEGGGAASAHDGQEFLRTIQVLIAVVVVMLVLLVILCRSYDKSNIISNDSNHKDAS
jgi:hypothetical protein